MLVYGAAKEMFSMDEDPPFYEYVQLSNPRNYRVLKLRPSVDPDYPLEGELVESEKPLPDLPTASKPGTSTDFSAIPSQQLPQFDSPSIPIPYEALSWTWGPFVAPTSIIRLYDDDYVSRFKITPNLEEALKGVRLRNRTRNLWVDALCIDQKNDVEKSVQVPNMDKIYGSATSVCIWLGPVDQSTSTAINFIENEVLNIWEFDKLCENLKKSRHWVAFMELMTRAWFSRRWVIQEIALAKEAEIYIGKERIKWNKFADAVSLFVEVESATHRLSEVMKKSDMYNHIPDFFGDVPSLGAVRLVEATSNLFRNTGRQKLLSLEYLVSDFPVFEASEPRDIVYALLSIARDTTAHTPLSFHQLPLPADIREKLLRLREKDTFQRLIKWAERNSNSQKYPISYEKDVDQVYKQFISFSIQNSDRTRALDIICRPWAPTLRIIDDPYRPGKTKVVTAKDKKVSGTPYHLPSWIRNLEDAPFRMAEHPESKMARRMERINADLLVGLPNMSQTGPRIYSAAGTRQLNTRKVEFKTRANSYSMFVEGFVLDTIDSIRESSQLGNLPRDWMSECGEIDADTEPPSEFWRTLVADRGPNGKNPPPFYARACLESIEKGWGEAAATKELINERRCTIVASFLRRAQVVIWNRCLIRTSGTIGASGELETHLGLVPHNAKSGDKICILYGCSVPVVLRRSRKSQSEVDNEELEDQKLLDEKTEKLATVMANLLRSRVKRRKEMFESGRKDPKVIAKVFLTHSRYFTPVLVGLAVDFWRKMTVYSMIVLISATLLFPQVVPGLTRHNPLRSYRFYYKIRRFMYYFRLSWPLLALFLSFALGFDSQKALLPVTLIFLFPEIFLADIVKLILQYVETQKASQKEKEGRVNDRGEYWTLIGECYIHGMMNGEAIAYQNNQAVPPRRFELR